MLLAKELEQINSSVIDDGPDRKEQRHLTPQRHALLSPRPHRQVQHRIRQGYQQHIIGVGPL